MDDNGSQTCIRDVEKDRFEEVDGQEDKNAGDDSCKGSTDTSFGFDGSAREGASGWVCAEESAENVCYTNCNKLLRRIDGVIVDPAEGFRDGDVLDEEDDDRYRDVACKRRDDLAVDLRYALDDFCQKQPYEGKLAHSAHHILETSGYVAQDGESRLCSVILVDEPADHGEEQEDDRRSESGDKEPEL